MLDLTFNTTGTRLATASADSTCKIYNVAEAECLMTLEGSSCVIKVIKKIFQKWLLILKGPSC